MDDVGLVVWAPSLDARFYVSGIDRQRPSAPVRQSGSCEPLAPSVEPHLGPGPVMTSTPAADEQATEGAATPQGSDRP